MNDHNATIIVLGVLALLIYFYPTGVARRRKNPNVEAIFLLNLFLGWTFLGWVAALVWAVLWRPKDAMVLPITGTITTVSKPEERRPSLLR